MSAPRAPLPPVSPDLTIGAVLAGFAVTLFLYGITSGQVITLFRRRGESRAGSGTRCLVTALWCLNTVHVVLASYIFFACAIFPHGDPSALFRLLRVFGAGFMVSEFPMVLVRLGYLYRMWRLTKRRKFSSIFALLAIVSLVVAALGIYFGVVELLGQLAAKVQQYHWMFYVVLSLQIVVDGSIAVAVFILFRRHHTGIRSLDVIISMITSYIISTGFLSVVFTFLGGVMFTVFPMTYIYTGLYWILAQLHSCSFLAVLNAQTELVERTTVRTRGRRAADNRVQFTTALELEAGRTSPHLAEAFELSEFAPSSSGSYSRGALEPHASGSGESQRPRERGERLFAPG